MRTVVKRIGIALFLIAANAPRFALAQPTSSAESLFEEGRRLLREGEVAAACSKFAQSQTLEPAGGTILNLAACHLREGKTATAWAEFNEARVQAQRDGREDRIAEATKQIELIEPRLSHLTIAVGASVPRGLEVRLDGVILGSASLGKPVVVDPGEHEVRVSAPGRVPWTEQTRVLAEGTAQVNVPFLPLLNPPAASAPPAPPAAVAPERVAPQPAASHTGAYLLGGLAIASAGVGTVCGLLAAGKKAESASDCTAAGCTTAGASLLRDANGLAWASNVAFGVSIVSIAVATYMLFTSTPRSRPPSSRAHAVIQLTGASMAVAGSW